MIFLSALLAPAAVARPAQAAIPKPVGDPGSWVTVNDYPADAVKHHQDGPVAFALNVDPAGNVASCRIAQSSGAPSLDAATCALLFVRARFEPARDEAGKSVAGTFSSRVRWIYPTHIEDAPNAQPVELGTSIRNGMGASELHIGTDGIITACDHAPRPYENVLAPPDLCKFFPVGSRYSAPGLSQGKPVKRKLTITFTVTDVNVR